MGEHRMEYSQVELKDALEVSAELIRKENEKII
jgi:hypothetical protein